LNKRKDDQELKDARDELWSIEAKIRGLLCQLTDMLNQVTSLSDFIEKKRQKEGKNDVSSA